MLLSNPRGYAGSACLPSSPPGKVFLCCWLNSRKALLSIVITGQAPLPLPLNLFATLWKQQFEQQLYCGYTKATFWKNPKFYKRSCWVVIHLFFYFYGTTLLASLYDYKTLAWAVNIIKKDFMLSLTYRSQTIKDIVKLKLSSHLFLPVHLQQNNFKIFQTISRSFHVYSMEAVHLLSQTTSRKSLLL